MITDELLHKAYMLYPMIIPKSNNKESLKDVEDINKDKREAYILGYRQAEKDLSDISWIKEVSGVKEMSRAQEEALKAFPPQSIAANYGNIARRDAFEFGYLKAEKDLELTWEDLKLLQNISHEVFAEVAKENVDYYQIYPTEQSFLEEVLKRFKEKQ